MGGKGLATLELALQIEVDVVRYHMIALRINLMNISAVTIFLARVVETLIACKAKCFPPYLRQAAKFYVATSHGVVRQETIGISEQRTAVVWFFAQEVDWCLKDCDKQHLLTTVSINLWKIFAGHTGDWFDVKTASICTTELCDALKNFILTTLKVKVAPYPIIVSLDTFRQDPPPPHKAILVIFGRRALIFFCLF